MTKCGKNFPRYLPPPTPQDLAGRLEDYPEDFYLTRTSLGLLRLFSIPLGFDDIAQLQNIF